MELAGRPLGHHLGGGEVEGGGVHRAPQEGLGARRRALGDEHDVRLDPGLRLQIELQERLHGGLGRVRRQPDAVELLDGADLLLGHDDELRPGQLQHAPDRRALLDGRVERREARRHLPLPLDDGQHDRLRRPEVLDRHLHAVLFLEQPQADDHREVHDTGHRGQHRQLLGRGGGARAGEHRREREEAEDKRASLQGHVSSSVAGSARRRAPRPRCSGSRCSGTGCRRWPRGPLPPTGSGTRAGSK